MQQQQQNLHKNQLNRNKVIKKNLPHTTLDTTQKHPRTVF